MVFFASPHINNNNNDMDYHYASVVSRCCTHASAMSCPGKIVFYQKWAGCG